MLIDDTIRSEDQYMVLSDLDLIRIMNVLVHKAQEGDKAAIKKILLVKKEQQRRIRVKQNAF